MIRLARKSSLLVAFSLLTSAATASAECAWVVWSYTVTLSPKGTPDPDSATWTPVASMSNETECRKMARGLPETLKNPFGGTVTASSTCLPDTVDPRGPKGK